MMETVAREVRATGTVVGHRHRKRVGASQGVSVLIHPVVKFETEGGESVEFESRLGSNVPPKVGGSVEVFYDPSHPDDSARITVGSALRFTKWHLIIAAAVVAIPVVFFFLFFVVMILVAII